MYFTFLHCQTKLTLLTYLVLSTNIERQEHKTFGPVPTIRQPSQHKTIVSKKSNLKHSMRIL